MNTRRGAISVLGFFIVAIAASLALWLLASSPRASAGSLPLQGTPTATPTATCDPNYVVAVATATIVPGVYDTGNHCNDCTTTVALPFPSDFYCGGPFNSVSVSSNGTLQFLSSNSSGTNVCLPTATLNFAALPLWDDLRTDDWGGACPTCGIFTSVTGTAPNRVFNIEWRAVYALNSCCVPANFEVRLHESLNRFDYIYANVDQRGFVATVGAQRDTGSRFVQWQCNSYGVGAGTMLTFRPYAPGEPTFTATPTNTPTPPTPPPPTQPPTSTFTSTPVATPSCVVNTVGWIPSCSGSTYNYYFGFYNYCPYPVYASGQVLFQVAPGYSGPWTTLDQANITQHTLPPGSATLAGSFTASSIPPGSIAYRFVANLTLSNGQVLNISTSAQTICGITPTVTPTPTGYTSRCSVFATGNQTSCAPGYYYYDLGFYISCGIYMYGSGTITFDVAASSGGPWATLDQRAFSGTYQPGVMSLNGNFFEPYIPPQYSWYRVRASGVWVGNHGASNETTPAPLCAQLFTATPTATDTQPPTFTSTATYTPPAYTPTATSTQPAGFTPTITPTRTTTPPCGPVWAVVPSANPGIGNNAFRAVEAISANDAWAVGYKGTTGGESTLIEHWNGTSWGVVPSPNMGTGANVLMGVAAATSTDAWAVGYYRPDSIYPLRPLALHWNGATWTPVPIPEGGWGDTYLYAVDAVAPDDVWAVGSADYLGTVITLAAHWNGVQWSIVDTPNPGPVFSDNSLVSVSARATNDVWAVGYSILGADPRTISMHWDGTAWTAVPSPNGPSGLSALWSVKAIAPSDVWAVGYNTRSTVGPLIMRWNGTAWNIVPGPDLGVGVGGALFGLAVSSPDGIWASGYYYPAGPSARTLVLYWDGVQWAQQATPNGGAGMNLLIGASTAPGTDAWAVGSTSSGPGAPDQTLVLRLQGMFTDVAPGDWYYEYVRCVFCRGGVVGYGDGTFRPYSFTTRGQLAKIVVLSLGLPINTAGGPHFSDVPITSPFYTYIETLYNRGAISGYADGTFRPNNNVSRGQVAKIVVLAAGWALIDPTTPTFADVPVGSAFYRYIETAFCHQVLGGYSDHTFRPGNSSTRAQIAKIVCLAARNPSNCGP